MGIGCDRMEGFGARLEGLRLKTGRTKKDISFMLGFSANVYGTYERGKRRPSLESIVKLADLFGVSLDYLMAGKETPVSGDRFLLGGDGAGDDGPSDGWRGGAGDRARGALGRALGAASGGGLGGASGAASGGGLGGASGAASGDGLGGASGRASGAELGGGSGRASGGASSRASGAASGGGFGENYSNKMQRILNQFEQYGINEPYILDAGKWHHLTKDDLIELTNHFDWVVTKAAKRRIGSGKNSLRK